MKIKKTKNGIEQARKVMGPAISEDFEVIGYLPETTEALLRHGKTGVYMACVGQNLRRVNPHSRKGKRYGPYSDEGYRDISMGAGKVSRSENERINRAKGLVGGSWADYHSFSGKFWCDFFGQLEPGDWETLKEIEGDGISVGSNAGAMVRKFLAERDEVAERIKKL